MKRSVSRFERPSSPLQMKALLRGARRAVWAALLLALGVHVSLTRIAGFEAEQKATKPLTTQFVKREPRLTKPLELKKRPQPKRRAVQREMVAVKARSGQQGIGLRESSGLMVRSLARPTVGIGRTVGFQERLLDGAAISEAIEGSREPRQRVDMGLEMLDIEALDTGQYQALVIQDPEDKQSVRGFCHLGIVPPITIERAVTWGPEQSFDKTVFPALPRLVAAMNQYTDVKTHVLGRIRLNDVQLFKTPWLLFDHREHFKLDDASLRNLGEYMICGGLVFADGCDIPVWYAGLTALRSALLDALKTQGIEAGVERLSNSHPVYHCYFDFDGPPISGDAAAHHDHPQVRFMGEVRDYLDGIEVDGRLVAIYSQKHYVGAWARFGIAPYEKWDAKRPLEFGVNTIVYALTQEGSITRRIVDSLR